MISTVELKAPASWPQLTSAIDGFDLSIGESLYLAGSIVTTAVSLMDRDDAEMVTRSFCEALLKDFPVRAESQE